MLAEGSVPGSVMAFPRGGLVLSSYDTAQTSQSRCQSHQPPGLTGGNRTDTGPHLLHLSDQKTRPET